LEVENLVPDKAFCGIEYRKAVVQAQLIEGVSAEVLIQKEVLNRGSGSSDCNPVLRQGLPKACLQRLNLKGQIERYQVHRGYDWIAHVPRLMG